MATVILVLVVFRVILHKEVGMNVYKDGGNGITRVSLDYWEKNKGKLGPISYVWASFDGMPDESVRDYPLEYNLVLAGERGVVFLSGCNCGYGGEGPNGTRKILEELGMPEQDARQLMYKKKFELVREVDKFVECTV